MDESGASSYSEGGNKLQNRRLVLLKRWVCTGLAQGDVTPLGSC
jgi:hypothetical protein